jgi:hypothetical protein
MVVTSTENGIGDTLCEGRQTHGESFPRCTLSLRPRVNRTEHQQTVVSELNRIGSEVDHAAKMTMANEASLRFPWLARQYFFMLTSAWNEKLSAPGQAISAIKKLAPTAAQSGDGGIGSNASAVVGGPHADEN